jgi:hypothetical protein
VRFVAPARRRSRCTLLSNTVKSRVCLISTFYGLFAEDAKAETLPMTAAHYTNAAAIAKNDEN